MNQYLNKCTSEIVGAFQLSKGDIEAMRFCGETCEAVEGDYMIVRGSNNKEISRKVFEIYFIKIK
jgi:hypothetical protein